MAEGMDEEQLVSFCHQLGLATDGYLSEQDLSVVCRCIGLVAPEEMMKQLFDELDGDHDGRVCLAELSLMLRGMQLPAQQKTTPYSDKSGSATEDTTPELSPMVVTDTDHFTFAIFDPDHKGFTKVGTIIDLWSRLGINPCTAQQVLKDLGFSTQSNLNSISLQDLGRSIDDEADSAKDGDLPPVFLAALLTYRTEAQYLRTLCETLECERDKLKVDIAEAHQRSTIMAQEIDEQNARLERTNQMELLKIESKYAEQIHTLQQTMSQEKESLLQTVQQLEAQLNELRDVEETLKSQIVKLKEENGQLESEMKNLAEEVKQANILKAKAENQLTHYIDLENEIQEMESRTSEKMNMSEEKLQKCNAEIQFLKDQNDELNSQLEKLKNALDGMKSLEGKRFGIRRRRKKGPTFGMKQEPMKIDDDHTCVPLEKMGKFHLHEEIVNGIEHDVEDAESSLEHFLSCSSQDIDSGTFQQLDKINFDNSAMDVSMQEEVNETPMMREANQESFGEKIDEEPRGKTPGDFEMDQKETDENDEKSSDQNAKRVQELEKELEEIKSAFEIERDQLRTQCSDLEQTLELLQTEYEKCEEYWHGKLQEERIEYEHDRNINDEKFQELMDKIKEYEELCLQQNEVSSKLPPIEERASLEKQVNDLDDECNCLREQLQSLQSEQQTTLANYQREWENKMKEECNHLEQQVQALQVKCHEYEIRLTSITEEDKHEEKSQLVTELQSKVYELENELHVQKKRHAEHVQDLERLWKRRNAEKPLLEVLPSTSAVAANHNLVQPVPGHPDISQLNVSGTSGKPPQSQMGPFWVQQNRHIPFYQTGETLSLPYVPSTVGPGPSYGNAGQQIPNGFDNWDLTPYQPTYHQPKKTWCHVEVGWLQALRAKLKQREDQCLMLQRALCSLEQQHEKILTDIKFQHRAEISNWEDLMKGSQELVRQQAAKQKEQADKLAHADNVIKDLYTENNRLVAAFNSAQQRINYLESVLRNSGSNNNAALSSGTGHSH